MTLRQKETADETRERIALVAEEMFRRMGFAKTAVADIAAALDMSPANVYRFFPSKNAIVETICNRCLGEVETQIADIAGGAGTPSERIAAVFLAILAYHRDNFLIERRVHDMVLVAIDHNWAAIEAHKLRVRSVLESLLLDGMSTGDYVPHDAREAGEILLGAMVRFCHPVLIAHMIDHDLEQELRVSLRFVLRSVETARTPFGGAIQSE